MRSRKRPCLFFALFRLVDRHIVIRHIALTLLLVALVAFAAPAARDGLPAEDWPAFRGPTGQGHSAERGVPFEWSESRNVAWKTPIPGLGWSSPVVAGGRVWVTTSIKDRGASLRAMATSARSQPALRLADGSRTQAGCDVMRCEKLTR